MPQTPPKPNSSNSASQISKEIRELKETNIKIWEDHQASYRKIFTAIVIIGGLICLLLLIIALKPA